MKMPSYLPLPDVSTSGPSSPSPARRSSPPPSCSRPATGPSGAARAGTARRRDQPAGALVARRRKRRLVAAVRRPIDARHLRQPAVSPDGHHRRPLDDAGAARRGRCRQRQGDVGAPGQRLPERRAAGPRGLGLAGRRSGDGQHLHVHGRRRAARVRARRQAAVGSIAARGVRRHHDARRPDDVADHRGRQDHPQRADSELGPGSRPAGQPVLRVRQADRADDLGELAAGASLRHELLDADRGRRQRVAAA